MKVLCIVMLLLTLGAGEREEPMEDCFSNMSYDIYKKKTECDGYYVAEQYAGEGAEEAQEKMNKRYHDCMQVVDSLVVPYLAAKADHAKKTIRNWLADTSENVSINKEVKFDEDYGYTVRIKGPRYAQTYVQVPEEYNPGYKPPERRPLRLTPLRKYSESEPPRRNVFRKPLAAVKAVFARIRKVFTWFKNLFWK